jgi:hypothetical protein
MRRFLSLIVVVLLAGCAHSNASLNSSGSMGGGTTAVGGQVSAGGSGAAAVALFAIAIVAIHGSEITYTQPVPELDGSRRVNEQDCSKPIKDWSANLKCR